MKDNNIEDKILEAALAVVSENSISGTRMHLIAEKADMVQSNVHYYFKTKNNLMLALQKKVVNRCLEIRNNIKDEYKDTLEDQLEIFIQQKLTFLLEEQEYDVVEVDFWLQGHNNLEIRKIMQRSFNIWREGIGEILDKYVPDLEPRKRRYIPLLTVSLLEGATMQYLIDKDGFEPEEYFKYCKEVILKNIRED